MFNIELRIVDGVLEYRKYIDHQNYAGRSRGSYPMAGIWAWTEWFPVPVLTTK